MQTIPTSDLLSLLAGIFPGVPQTGTASGSTGAGLGGTFEAVLLDMLARAGVAPSDVGGTPLPALLASLLQAPPPGFPDGGPNGDSEGPAERTAALGIPPDLLSRFEALTGQIAADNHQAAASAPTAPMEAFIRLVADRVEAATGGRPDIGAPNVQRDGPSLATSGGLRLVANAANSEHVEAAATSPPLSPTAGPAAASARGLDRFGAPPLTAPETPAATAAATVLGNDAVTRPPALVSGPTVDFPSVVLLHGELARDSTGRPSIEALRFLSGTPAATVLASRGPWPFAADGSAGAGPGAQAGGAAIPGDTATRPALSPAQPAVEPPRADSLERAIEALTARQGTHAAAEQSAVRDTPAVQVLAERLAILSAAREGMAQLRGESATALTASLPPDVPAGGETAAVGFGQTALARPSDQASAALVSARPAPVALDRLPQHVVREAHFLARQDGGSVQLRLQPESLGRLTVRVMQDHDVVRIELTAQSQQVREVLQGQLPQLRQQLGDLGLSLGGLTVSVETGDRQGAGGPRQGPSPEGTASASPAGIPAVIDTGLPRQSAPRVAAGRLDLVA